MGDRHANAKGTGRRGRHLPWIRAGKQVVVPYLHGVAASTPARSEASSMVKGHRRFTGFTGRKASRSCKVNHSTEICVPCSASVSLATLAFSRRAPVQITESVRMSDRILFATSAGGRNHSSQGEFFNSQKRTLPSSIQSSLLRCQDLSGHRLG